MAKMAKSLSTILSLTLRIHDSFQSTFTASGWMASSLPPPDCKPFVTLLFSPGPAPQSLPDPRNFNVVDGVVGANCVPTRPKGPKGMPSADHFVVGAFQWPFWPWQRV
jgi:hypothetical protein